METKEIKNKIDGLSETLKKLVEEIKEIREQCQHLESEITNISKTPGSFELGKTCSTCGEMLGYPTVEEKRKAGYD